MPKVEAASMQAEEVPQVTTEELMEYHLLYELMQLQPGRAQQQTVNQSNLLKDLVGRL